MGKAASGCDKLAQSDEIGTQQARGGRRGTHGRWTIVERLFGIEQCRLIYSSYLLFGTLYSPHVTFAWSIRAAKSAVRGGE
jgi:hypothetical protein